MRKYDRLVIVAIIALAVAAVCTKPAPATHIKVQPTPSTISDVEVRRC
jgi:hypothetical protein